ncbi:MAG: hisitidine kinase [Parcubacteria group bacterium GW2011_GWA1_42_7]|nr:MAG: hisitidine kinase [Parcubacteria group bacterium GW2011_GWB1_42_6]KKS69793.1 MAG: hisitidine kinase [Parcubacteria group bacterium GW2011_GWA1_42_7]KKS91792.1 MAG: hisitidine kinase [Parcubacteria group bacterium GW2011_GWC1_43_12]
MGSFHANKEKILEGNKKKKILIVDDEESIREIFEIFLKREGFDVSLAENGEEGIKAMESQNFDLVITDIDMPGKTNGFGVIEAAYRSAPEIKVIGWSGNITGKRADWFKERRISFFEKPIYPLSKLKEKIDELFVRELV